MSQLDGKTIGGTRRFGRNLRPGALQAADKRRYPPDERALASARARRSTELSLLQSESLGIVRSRWRDDWEALGRIVTLRETGASIQEVADDLGESKAWVEARIARMRRVLVPGCRRRRGGKKRRR